MSTRPPKRLHWGIPRDPETLDWTACHDSVCLNQVALVMEGLTKLSWGEAAAITTPALAEEWKWISPTQIKFKIRKNVRWTDGEPLRAIHFLQSWKYTLKHQALNPNATLLFALLNARAFAESKVGPTQLGVTIPDPLTLIVTLQAPMPNFPSFLSHPATWPMRFDTPRTGQPTLGQFELVRWNPGINLNYSRNSNYYGTRATLDGVETHILAKPMTRIQLFLNRELDLVDEIEQPNLLPQDPGIRIMVPTARQFLLVFNTLRRPFQNVEVRNAFVDAIQRDEIGTFSNSFQQPSFRLIPLSPALGAPSWLGNFSPSAAQSALKSFRVVDSSGLPRTSEATLTRQFPKPLLAISKIEPAPALGENLQAQWAKNLEVAVDTLAGDGESTAASLYLISVNSEATRPGAILEMFVSGSPRNIAHWKNRAYDDLIERALHRTPNQVPVDAIDPWLQSAEEILVGKEKIVFPIAVVGKAALKQVSLTGLKQTPLSLWDFSEVTKE